MGRIKRGYVREIPSDELKRDYRVFAIACEGAVREVDYFSQLEGISSRVIIEHIKDEEYADPPSSPEHVLRRAEDYSHQYGLNDEDSIWLVMDVDRWEMSSLSSVHQRCRQKQNWNMILSNPCFEVWLFYHTKSDLATINATRSAEFKTALNDETSSGYNPQRYILLVKDAMENAKNADTSKGWFPDFKTTQVYQLIESLINFIGINEFNRYLEIKRNEQ